MLYSYHHDGKKKGVFALITLTLFFLCVPFVLFAQEGSMSLTIAPPLFQLNLQPGETWSSVISVVNDNPYDVTLFAEPTLFEPAGESGTPVFVAPPAGDDLETGEDASTLAGWITVPQGPLQVIREQTYQLPIVIHVPEDATPGGHYAAVLIGNHAPQGVSEGSLVSVTSSIAALVFLSVSGDVIEKGRIRDFFTEESLYETPEATLSFRFENQGNVHILPQGNIVIYNMFGKQRGLIPINYHRDYGNVLPGSIRKFTFTWKSDAGIWDIGRYRAEATIGYGKEQKQTALATTYFYVLPIVPLIEIIGGFIAFIVFIGWALRAYVRRALAIESAHLMASKSEQATVPFGEQQSVQTAMVLQKEQPKLSISTLVKPIQVGFVDLRRASSVPERRPDATVLQTVRSKDAVSHKGSSTEQQFYFTVFLHQYRFFFVFVAVTIVSIFAMNIYFSDVMTTSRDFSAAEIRSDGSLVPVDDAQDE